MFAALDKNHKETPDFNTLKNKIIDWGKERGIVKQDNHKNQLLKTISELGELSDAILKNDLDEIIDGIGDVQVTLILLAKNCGLDIVECLESAYNEIKDRTGKTVDGTFIKD